MFRSPIHVALPRRVTAYYLLFCTVAVAWLTVVAIAVVQGMLNSQTEGACLTKLGRASSTIGLDYVRNGSANLQSVVERLRAESSLSYCAVVSSDRRILAHSSLGQVGETYREPAGERIQWGDVERVRFASPDSQTVLEYRAPLKGGHQVFGTLHMAVREPSLLETILQAAHNAPVASLGATFFIALGSLVLYRTVRPMAGIDQQLRQLARAATPSDVPLQPVPVLGGAALGWNRLVAQQGGGDSARLNDRLTDAVRGYGRRKTDDILNSLTDGVLLAGDEGRIELANQAAAAMIGSDDAEALLGREVLEVLDLGAPKTGDSPLLDPDLRARTVVTEIRQAGERGSRVFRVSRHPLRVGEQKSGSGHVWTIRDVTQQKLAEQMRDQFLDAATHELRTPLANIKAYAETLTLSEIPDVEQQKQFCNTINAEATRLARFIDDLLSISSLEAGSLMLNRQEVHFDRLLREVFSKVQPQMDLKEIIFESHLPAKMPELQLDKDKFSAALVNLLGNAAKYTPQGGRVAVHVRWNEQRLEIAVQDTGVGISEEELPRVFEKFFRSSDARVQAETGTGLGLSFAQEVIRLHGGTLTVQSEANKGSTFTITLATK
jgi:signal transduction histidine kinase